MLAELIIPAISIGFFHCVCGPDHYVPFVAMSRVGLWSLRKTLLITILCGVGHVIGSAVLGFIGIGLGLIVWQLQADVVQEKLGAAESVRGDLAGWLLFGFGVVYTLWGFYRGFRTKQMGETSELPAGETNGIPIGEAGAAPHSADGLVNKTGRFTPWVLFTIFLFGPCEPLIPMLMIPASKADMLGVVWITLLFGVTTLLTMTSLVTLIYLGAFAVRFHRLQQWGHALAGSVVAGCGASILFLGL